MDVREALEFDRSGELERVVMSEIESPLIQNGVTNVTGGEEISVTTTAFLFISFHIPTRR
jgi:hypothetical protein